MRKNIGEKMITILSILFIVSTIVLLWMKHKNVGGKFALKFGTVYVCLLLGLLLCCFVMVILKSRKLKWVHIRKILIKFICMFLSYGILNHMFNYFFRPNKLDLYKSVSNAITFSIGICIFEIIFLKKKVELG